MAKFMLLHIGFEKPTPEIMEAWNRWFEGVADVAVGARRADERLRDHQ